MKQTLTDLLVEAGVRAKDIRYVKDSPNDLGEWLRKWAFVDKIGAVNTFKTRKDLLVELDEKGILWFNHEKSELRMGYKIGKEYTTLMFYSPELKTKHLTGVLINSECSKDYMWYFQEIC